jgi:4-phytase / acid phosphatase
MKYARRFAVVLLGFSALPTLAIAADHLERVVIVMRHGVRPPTKSAEALAPLADKPWPGDDVWGVKPGELTHHGEAEIRKLGKDLAARYAGEGPRTAVIWADGADQRTRESARNLARGFAPDAPPAFGQVPDGAHDPLFSGPGADACPFDPAKAEAGAKGLGPLVTPKAQEAIVVAQRVAAPNGCTGGGGPCLQGETTLTVTAKGVKIDGPLATGAALAEDFLLEYEDGLPMQQVGWGRMSRADLDTVMATHRRLSDIERAAPYVASRRGATMAKFIVAALSEDAVAPASGPQVKAGDRMIVLAGHDTNLANMAGAFGLDWTLPKQPDTTAPGTVLAFERWRGDDGKPFVKVRIFYTDPDQVRTLAEEPAHELALTPAACAGETRCSVERFAAFARARVREACPDLKD